MGTCSLLQGVFLTQGLNLWLQLHVLHCRQILTTELPGKPGSLVRVVNASEDSAPSRAHGPELWLPQGPLTCSPLSPLLPFCPGSPISPCGKTGKTRQMVQ